MNNFIFGENAIHSSNTRLTGINNNVCILGSSGSGKSATVSANLAVIDDESIIVSDTKGLLYKMFRDSLEEKGYRTYLIDFKNPSNSTVGFNMFDTIRITYHDDGTFSYSLPDIQRIACCMAPPIGRKDDPFWDFASRKLLEFYITFMLETYPRKKWNMRSILEIHENMGNIKTRDVFELHALKEPDSPSTRRYHEFSSMFRADKTWACVYEFVCNALKLFSSDEICNLTSRRDSIDIASIGHQKSALFLSVSDTDRSSDNLLNTFYTQALQVLCNTADEKFTGALDVPVRFILDDFACNFKIVDFDKIVSVIRSRNISAWIILQSLSQLQSQYGNDCSTTILNNFDRILFLGANDMQTASYIGSRALVSPETILTMKRNCAYLLVSGEKGRLIRKLVPYAFLKDMESQFKYEEAEQDERPA